MLSYVDISNLGYQSLRNDHWKIQNIPSIYRIQLGYVKDMMLLLVNKKQNVSNEVLDKQRLLFPVEMSILSTSKWQCRRFKL